MCVCVRVCACMRVCACVCVRTCACTCVSMHASVCLIPRTIFPNKMVLGVRHTLACMDAHMHTCTRACTCAHTHTLRLKMVLGVRLVTCVYVCMARLVYTRCTCSYSSWKALSCVVSAVPQKPFMTNEIRTQCRGYDSITGNQI